MTCLTATTTVIESFFSDPTPADPTALLLGSPQTTRKISAVVSPPSLSTAGVVRGGGLQASPSYQSLTAGVSGGVLGSSNSHVSLSLSRQTSTAQILPTSPSAVKHNSVPGQLTAFQQAELAGQEQDKAKLQDEARAEAKYHHELAALLPLSDVRVAARNTARLHFQRVNLSSSAAGSAAGDVAHLEGSESDQELLNNSILTANGMLTAHLPGSNRLLTVWPRKGGIGGSELRITSLNSAVASARAKKGATNNFNNGGRGGVSQGSTSMMSSVSQFNNNASASGSATPNVYGSNTGKDQQNQQEQVYSLPRGVVVTCVDASSSGDFVLVGTACGRVMLLDMCQPSHLRTVFDRYIHLISPVRSVRFSPDSKAFLSLDHTGELYVFSSTTLSLLGLVALPKSLPFPRAIEFLKVSDGWGLVLLTNEAKLVTCRLPVISSLTADHVRDIGTKLLLTPDFTEITTWDIPFPAHALAADPTQEDMVWLLGVDKKLLKLKLRVKEFDPFDNSDNVPESPVSGSGEAISERAQKQAVKVAQVLISVSAHDKIALPGSQRPSCAVAISPDGQLIATGGSDGAIELRALQAPGTYIRSIAHHQGVSGLVFPAGSGLLLSTGAVTGLLAWGLQSAMDDLVADDTNGEDSTEVKQQDDKAQVNLNNQLDLKVALASVSAVDLATDPTVLVVKSYHNLSNLTSPTHHANNPEATPGNDVIPSSPTNPKVFNSSAMSFQEGYLNVIKLVHAGTGQEGVNGIGGIGEFHHDDDNFKKKEKLSLKHVSMISFYNLCLKQRELISHGSIFLITRTHFNKLHQDLSTSIYLYIYIQNTFLLFL